MDEEQVLSLLKDASGRVCGAHVRDQVDGREFDIRAKSVINATGPFCDAVRQMDDPKTQRMIEPSAGVHIMLSDRCKFADSSSCYFWIDLLLGFSSMVDI
jgi:glycerol-3-phosphate dehydrogenase